MDVYPVHAFPLTAITLQKNKAARGTILLLTLISSGAGSLLGQERESLCRVSIDKSLVCVELSQFMFFSLLCVLVCFERE